MFGKEKQTKNYSFCKPSEAQKHVFSGFRTRERDFVIECFELEGTFRGHLA